MFSRDNLHLYLFEILREASIVKNCYQRFEAASERWLESAYATNRTGAVEIQGSEAEEDMLAALEGFVAAFARISLFFFPARTAGEIGRERGRLLRDLVGIADTHPLANRTLRNDWMHLDERMDREIEQSREVPLGYFIQLRGDVSEVFAKQTVRLIDPGQGRVYVFGTPYSLREMFEAVDHVAHEVVLAIAPR